MHENIEILNNQIGYDVIFVGQLGAVVCNILLAHNNNNFKYLVINNSKQVNQPGLIPFQNPNVSITKLHPKLCDFEGEKIFKIFPEDNVIQMQNQKCYHYKYLVYTDDTKQWSDFSMIQNLQNALKTKYSFVYSNVLKSQPKLSHPNIIFQQVKKGKNIQKRISCFQNSRSKFPDTITQNHETQRIFGGCNMNIIFYIPKPPHAGYDNINILYKLEQFLDNFNEKVLRLKDNKQKLELNTKDRNDKQSKGQREQRLNFILLLEGQHIFPMCRKIDLLIEQRISEKGVRILKNHQINKIDYLRRKIMINFTEQNSMENEEYLQGCILKTNKLSLKFDYLYVIIKQKVPTILQISSINPFKNSEKTLANSQFKNIFIFGADIFPTTHSFLAVNHQAHIIAENVRKLLRNKAKKSPLHEILLNQYNGYTSFPFWLDRSKYIQLKHQYQQTEVQQKSSKKGKVSEIEQRVVIKEPGCCFSFIQRNRYQLLFNLQVSLFYNLKIYGAPFYLFVPEVSEKG